MDSVSKVAFGTLGYFGNSGINFRSYDSPTPVTPVAKAAPSSRTLLQLHELRKALSAIKPRQLTSRSVGIAAQAAGVTSSSSLQLSSNATTSLQSVEQINTAPTSFQQNGPAWNPSTVTAPWSGLGSTADATVGGSYDGSNGVGTLTFKVTRAGEHGADDLKIRVLAPDGSNVETINIDKNDPLDKVYALSNGLTITLNEGVLVKNDTFEVDTSLVSTSYTPANPGWAGSTADPSIGGAYDGSNGTGDLTFLANRGGVHGEDDIKFRVYAPDNSLIDSFTVRKNDAIDKVYSLSNGLEFTLGAGEVIKNETFTVSVDAADPGNYTSSPDWNFSSSTATFTGTYDGSNGTGTLTFKALDNGVHGEDDLRVRVYNPDGSTLETIDIDANDPMNQSYTLSNGLSVTFSAGDMIKNETFTIDVQATATYSTSPNQVESTAEAAIGGVYDGSLGTDTLTFTVTQEGIHGTDDLTLDVHSSDGTFLETITVNAADPIDQSYALANGLSFSLGAGTLALNETFTMDVNDTVPTTVNPNLSFSGIGLNDAKLEEQFTITDGSFEINGNSIDVYASDSISSVLDRINNSGIDVTATFNAATDSIVLTRDTPGSENDIVLSNDTSGFLAATKLSTATSQTGTGDETSLLSNLSIMSSVSSGTLDINGVSVAFDKDVDSLQDVLDRVESLVLEVETNYDSNTGLVSITSTGTADLVISSGGTGFFAALKINEGLYEHVEATSGSSRRGGYSTISRRDMAKAINDFSRQLNRLFDDKTGLNTDPYLDQVRSQLKTAISETLNSDDTHMDTGMGIAFDFAGGEKGVFQFEDTEKSKLYDTLKTSQGAKAFHNLFFGTEEKEGVFEQLLVTAKDAERNLTRQLGSIGVYVDLFA